MNVQITFHRKNICGICEHPLLQNSRNWKSPLSHSADAQCLRWIQSENTVLQKVLDRYFPDSPVYRSSAQSIVVNEIKKEIGDISLLDYHMKYGSEALSFLITSKKVENALLKFKETSQAKPRQLRH